MIGERFNRIISPLLVLVTLTLVILSLETVRAKELAPKGDDPSLALPSTLAQIGLSTTQTITATPTLELTTAGWVEAGLLTTGDISVAALTPVDCATMTPPVVGYEISKGQDPNDIVDFSNDLIATGYSVGTVDISGGVPPPPCVNVLIVQGSIRGGVLQAPYTLADGALLQSWTSNRHGLMISGDWGLFRAGTVALFQTYGYSQQGAGAVTDPTDSDPAGPPNEWVIYQTDNFAPHPILTGLPSLELLASSWLSPTTNAIVTTDADAAPPGVPVLAAFNDGAGCVTLVGDSNWNGTVGYLKQNNALLAQQMVQWLMGCSRINLAKSAAPNPVPAGQILTYTILASNVASTTLTNVLITDTVPASTTFVSASTPHSGPDARRVISWSLGNLAMNASATVTMAVRIDSTVPNNTPLTNTAWITSNEGLTDTATVVSLVSNQLVNPVIIKAVNPAQAQIGQVVTYTLTVQQAGANSNASNVRVVDVFPGEVDIESVQVSSGQMTTTGQTVTWLMPLLAPLDVGLMTVRARVNANAVPAPLTFNNQAWLSFDQGPDRPSNLVAVFVPAQPLPQPTKQPPPPPLPQPPPKLPPSSPPDDDDDDDETVAPAPTAPPAAPALTATPTLPVVAALPVSILPDTGQNPDFSNHLRSALIIAGLIGGAGLLLRLGLRRD
jgi:uncharacterized repeat protein (TIGR01451 family)